MSEDQNLHIKSIPLIPMRHPSNLSPKINEVKIEDKELEQPSEVTTTPEMIYKGPPNDLLTEKSIPFQLRSRSLTCLDELESDDELTAPIRDSPRPGEKRKPGRPRKPLNLLDILKIPKKVGRPKNESLIDERHIVAGHRRSRGRPKKIIDPIITVGDVDSAIVPGESSEKTPSVEPKASIQTKSQMKPVVVEFEEQDVLNKSLRADSDFDSDAGSQGGYVSEDSSKDWRPSSAISRGAGQHGSRRGRPRKYPKVERDPNLPRAPRGRPRKAGYVPKDPNQPVRPRGRPKKEKLLDETWEASQSPNPSKRPVGRPRKSEVKEEKPEGIVEFEYDDEVEDDLTKFVYVKSEEVKKLTRRKPSEIEKQRELIHADVFASPKKQKLGSISLSATPSPSKKGILQLPGSSPSRTPNGRAGSPRKMNRQQLQDKSARKKATKVIYSQLMDEDIDDNDEEYEEERKLAERIINESRKPVNAAPSPFNTPKRKNNIDLPAHNPDFVPTPLPTAAEEESFLDGKFLDKALFLDGPEGYFDQHRTRVKTSNNSMVQAPPLEYDELNSFVLLSGFLHNKEKQKLINTYKEMYTQWYFELSEGFSLVLFGIGSKRRLLLDYVEEYLTKMVDAPTIVVNGYNPATVFKEVLMTIVSTLNLKKVPKRLGDLVDHIVEYFQKKDHSMAKLILLIHNIDGPGLRDEKTQVYLSKLASIKQFYVLVSVDHINAPLLWDSVSLNNFNFLWHNTTTFADYLTETSFQDLLTLGQTQKSAGSKGAKYVLSSLTTNSRSLYRVLVSNQLQNMEDDLSSKKVQNDNQLKGTIKHALEYKKFYTLCAEEFISSNEINFRTMLMEFVEHKMAVLTKDQSGTEMVFIPFSLEELQKLLEDELL